MFNQGVMVTMVSKVVLIDDCGHGGVKDNVGYGTVEVGVFEVVFVGNGDGGIG